MHQCNYCSESFFSGYSLISHMKVHNKGKDVPLPGVIPNNFSSLPTTTTTSLPQTQVMDYSWHQNSSWYEKSQFS